MTTQEQALVVGEDAAPEFLFDAALSTAIAANGHREAKVPLPNGPLTPGLLDKMNLFHVRGYMDRSTTTTPFDMVVLNEMSRFHLAIEALKHIPRLRIAATDAIDLFHRKLLEHHEYIRQHLEDMPEIRNWHWTADFSEPSAPPPLAKGHPRAALFTNS